MCTLFWVPCVSFIVYFYWFSFFGKSTSETSREDDFSGDEHILYLVTNPGTKISKVEGTKSRPRSNCLRLTKSCWQCFVFVTFCALLQFEESAAFASVLSPERRMKISSCAKSVETCCRTMHIGETDFIAHVCCPRSRKSRFSCAAQNENSNWCYGNVCIVCGAVLFQQKSWTDERSPVLLRCSTIEVETEQSRVVNLLWKLNVRLGCAILQQRRDSLTALWGSFWWKLLVLTVAFDGPLVSESVMQVVLPSL